MLSIKEIAMSGVPLEVASFFNKLLAGGYHHKHIRELEAITRLKIKDLWLRSLRSLTVGHTFDNHYGQAVAAGENETTLPTPSESARYQTGAPQLDPKLIINC